MRQVFNLTAIGYFGIPMTCRVSIVVPTYCESENLPQLVPQLAEAFHSRNWEWEVIVVDDNSPDGTPQVLTDLARQCPQVRFLIRKEDRGLSSAVLAGFDLARYEYLLVMDADLSHPPETAPNLIDPLVEDRADFVIGSRYVAGGRTEDWGLFRWLNSFVATALGRPFVGPVKDSMAGFFALRRAELLAGDEFNPIGYKIGLELIVKCHVKRVMEVPIVFRNRVRGESKLSLHEQFRYLEHLSRLYDYRYPKGSRRVKFLIASACEMLVAVAIIIIMYGLLKLPFAAALPVGLFGLLAMTLVFFARFVRAQRDFILMKHPFREFTLISMAEFVAGTVTGMFLINKQAVWTAVAGAFVALLVVRFILRKVMQHDVRGVRRRKPLTGEPNRFLRQEAQRNGPESESPNPAAKI